MSCHHVFNLLSAYIDGELTGTQMLEVRRHISECDECRQEYEDLLKTKQLLANLTFAMPKTGFAEDLRKKLDEASWAKKRKFHLGEMFNVKLSPIAAALAFVAIALTMLGNIGLKPINQQETVSVASNNEYFETNQVSTMPEIPEDLKHFTNNKPLPVVSNLAQENYDFVLANY